ncbi:MAG: DcaP family trimeric outer membrane transporter [Gemmatimonadota bacterium]|nr:DcaP family trimeric outer membrane transporter [Gemmatimonadota bacterium]
MLRRLLLLTIAMAPLAGGLSAQDPEEQLRELQAQVDSLRRLDLERQLDEMRRDIAGRTREGSDTWLELNGWVNFDLIYDFKRVDPTWEATLRPSTIPTTPGQYGSDGKTIFSVRQTRVGLSGGMDTRIGPAKWWIELDFFALGADAGRTALELRHAWGEVGPLGFGWTWSNFIDIDTWPNVLDWWGPSAMALNRNPQVRYTWALPTGRFALAIENSNQSLTTGVLGETSPGFVDDIEAVGRIPDLTANYRHDWGDSHVQIAGVARQLSYETVDEPDNEPKGSEFGWGLNLTAVLQTVDRDRFRGGIVYGHGIASFINDGGGVNLAPDPDGGALALPSLGLTAYYDHYWTDVLSTSLGASYNTHDNSSEQQSFEIESVTYGSTNLIWAPSSNFWAGAEFQLGRRLDISEIDAFDYRIQFQVRYTFVEALR